MIASPIGEKRRGCLHIEHLSLTNFRNYTQLELDLPLHLVVLRGDNARGKSNLLEAIYFLATARSHRAAGERELMSWFVTGAAMPVARLLARAQTARGPVEVEIALRGTYATAEEAHFQKRIKINGIRRRAVDLVGQLNVVIFGPHDIELISGAPSLRRRYLDLTDCQIDRRYLRSLQRYNKAIQQRNHLLRSITERRAEPDQLDFWDNELVEAGSYLVAQRQLTVAELSRHAQLIHCQLTAGKEELSMFYRPSVGIEDFAYGLKSVREKEIAQGISLIGPHRDDFQFSVNGIDMSLFGSRGQQRTIAVSLKLAEARFIHSKTGDHPILLLDDVLSELDSARRHHILESISSYEQVIMTAIDLGDFAPSFLAQALLFEVGEGKIESR